MNIESAVGHVDTVQSTGYERSKAVRDRNQKVLAQETVGTVKLPRPLYAAEGRGSKLIDPDGIEYIDLTMGLGPHLLGHNPEVVLEATRDALTKGMLFGISCPSQGDLAELVVEASPCAEKVMFCNSGTEATMYAIRLARAFTGKSKVASFDGAYHGAHDYVLMEGVLEPDPHNPKHKPFSFGIPDSTVDQIRVLPYRDANALELIREHKDELACVIIEPSQGSNPRVDVEDFLKELREVCTESGVLLILDEVLTGFRLAYGGGQERFGVTADIVTYGKILGGGMPIGAVAGPNHIMHHFNVFECEKPIFAGGTFAGNPVSMHAGIAMLTYLRDHPEVYDDVRAKAERIASSMNGFFEAGDYPVHVLQSESILCFVFSKDRQPRAYKGDDASQKASLLFFGNLLERRCIIPGPHTFFLSTAHTDEDIDFVLEAMKESFVAVRKVGAL